MTKYIAITIFFITLPACSDNCDTIENAEAKATTDAESCEYALEYRDSVHCDSLIGSVPQPAFAYDDKFCELKAEDCEPLNSLEEKVCN